MDPNEELVGADLMEHRIRHSKIGISRAISALSPLRVNLDDVSNVHPIGMNPGHEGIVDELQVVSQPISKKKQKTLKFYVVEFLWIHIFVGKW